MELNGKTVLVTGGGSGGMGLAIAKALPLILLSCCNSMSFGMTPEARQSLGDVEEIVFAARKPGNDGHYYISWGRSVGGTAPGYAYYNPPGRLCALNLKSGQVRSLVNDLQGTVRDPQVHYDGKRILFSYRPGGSESFHLYEINTDGSNLRQLTDGPFDDLEPSYMPDGRIVFCSSRCNRYVNCMLCHVAVLFTCDADGSDIRQLSPNKEMETTPWMLPDGRIMYTRWEYVDRSFGGHYGLWTTNGDGSFQTILFGNMLRAAPYLDAKPIPDTRKVVFIHSAHMGREHAGSVATIDPTRGPDDSKRGIRFVTKKGQGNYRDPYPLDEYGFLVADEASLLLMDTTGESETLYQLPSQDQQAGIWIHEPRPIRRRPREQPMSDRIDLAQTTGTLMVSDIYHGRNMEGIKRGEIKKLLVMEALPKPVNFHGSMHPISWLGAWALKRVLGTVPVEEDGSAYFELPANRQLFFAALDENDRAVKRMQSFVTVQPGETTGCVGCHEQRTEAPRPIKFTSLSATQRDPSTIEPFSGVPDVFDYPRDIQPILDRHCVACHDYEATEQGGPREGKVILCGDRGPYYAHGYANLLAHGEVIDARAGEGNRKPRSTFSAASPLLDKLDGDHYDVQLSPREQTTLRLWIDASATYAGTYGALGHGMLNMVKNQRYAPISDAIARRCATCHEQGLQSLYIPEPGQLVKSHALPDRPEDRLLHREIIYNLSRPDKSMALLAPLAADQGGYGLCGGPAVFNDRSDPDYVCLLEAIQAAKADLDRMQRFDCPGFVPQPAYIREMKNYGVLPQDQSVNASIDVYETDQAYWKTFWWHGSSTNNKETSE